MKLALNSIVVKNSPSSSVGNVAHAAAVSPKPASAPPCAYPPGCLTELPTSRVATQ
jgi:hypothetical protein